ncbi:hypothetical protein PLICRDRAFT_64608, partial [Plicaturopsis crispa FD-325 SS-3]
RTERILDYLDEHPDIRQKLFSDSVEDAKAENRKKRTGKTPKSHFHGLIANAVFSVDADRNCRQDFAAHPEKYAKSIDNYLTRLKNEYRSFNEKLGKTGAGLLYEEVQENSDLRNLIDKLMIDFPWWPRLQGYWRSLPNFNPHAVSSQPGQDLSGEAQELL